MKRLLAMAHPLAFAATLILSFTPSAQAQTMHTGTLADGATYLIEVPEGWRGTLLLYSHGYVIPGTSNPAQDVGDPVTRASLLASGYALAGSSYATTGWAIHEALPDQIAVLDQFVALFGHPRRTIAWGHSLGGMITAALIQRYPARFDAALPMCGVLSGGVGSWNVGLDQAFAFKTLVAPNSALQIVNITNPIANLALADQLLAAAQLTPQGRARIALGAALNDVPGWFTPLSPEPAAADTTSQETNQFLWASQINLPFGFAFRAELEARAGGNVSWNTRVDYRKQLARSSDRDEVVALYQAAGLDLDADLDTLNDTPRISADTGAVEYLEQNIIYDGEIRVPVLTLHTTGDGLVEVENESAYRDVVDEAGQQRFLRQIFVHRAGHCAFTPAETVTALENLIARLDTGKWPNLQGEGLNAEAESLGPLLNIFAVQSQAGAQILPTSPAFVDFHPRQFLRPFDALEHGFDFLNDR